MVDKTEITADDIDDTLRGLGIVTAKTASRPAPPTNDDIDETLRQLGVFPESPAERAALRQRSATKRTTLPAGPGFPPVVPDPPPEVKELAERQGFVGQAARGIPLAGPLLERGGAAVAAAVKDEPNTTFEQRYEGYLDQLRQADRWYEHQNPVKSTLAKLTGAVAGTGPLAATRIGQLALGLRGPSLGSRVVTGGLGGATIGGVDAALHGDNALAGTIIGGMGGAGGPMIGEVARGATNLASHYLWPRTGALRDFSTNAVSKLTGALEGETGASIAAGRERMGPAGMLGDLNSGMSDLVGGLAAGTGPAKGTVREAYRVRDAGARARIEQSATDAAGPPVNLMTFEKMTTEGRKLAADPLYDQFRSTKIQPTNEIKGLIPRLQSAGAFDQAEKLAGITGEPLNMKFFTGGSQKDFPTAQTWDYVKRGLDSKIDAAYSAGDNTTARALVGLKNELLTEIGKAPGGQIYAQARKAFADHSALLDQVKAGRDTFLGARSGLSADELAEELKGLSRPELTARLIGMRGAVKDTMGATTNGDTTMRNQFLAPNNVKKLELMIGKDKADALVKSMKQEKFLKDQSQTLIHGTQTTPKAEQVKALQQSPLPEWNPSLVEPLSLIPPHLRDQLRPTSIIDAWRGQRHGETMNQLARAVTTPEGPRLDELIQALAAEAQRQQRVGTAGAVGSNLLTGVITGPGTTMARRQHARRPLESVR